MTKPKRFLDSLREMVSPPPDKNCTTCHTPYAGDFCPSCGSTSGNGSSSDKTGAKSAYLVDLVSNHKIQIPIPLCKVGRDECNDIVISGDQAISRQHLIILKEGELFFIEDVKSRHGTFINGNQLTTRELISDGDVLKIGVSLFWFVTEAPTSGEEAASAAPLAGASSKQATTGGEPQHVSVKSEFFSEPTDPSTSTASDIPVMTNEEVLLDRLRLKTRSFEHADMFVQAQLQPGALRSSLSTEMPVPAKTTQPFLPALDSVLAGVKTTPANDAPMDSAMPQRTAVATKLAEIQEAVINPATTAAPIQPTLAPEPAPAAPHRQSLNDHLSKLGKEHNQLQSQIEQAEKRRQEIGSEITSIKELINSLISGTDTALIAASQRVLSQLGWQCAASTEGGQDLQLKADNQTVIAHIMWTADKPERTHLGKLFIAQTRFWCDQGVEPKGIFIISLLGGDGLKQDAKVELANFVKNKNVCLLTTANLLAIYHDITFNHVDGSVVREKITHTDGWLEGFDLEPLQEIN